MRCVRIEDAHALSELVPLIITIALLTPLGSGLGLGAGLRACQRLRRRTTGVEGILGFELVADREATRRLL